MNTKNPILSAIGRKGGQAGGKSRTAAKIAASRRNIAKAREALLNPQPQNDGGAK